MANPVVSDLHLCKYLRMMLSQLLAVISDVERMQMQSKVRVLDESSGLLIDLSPISSALICFVLIELVFLVLCRCLHCLQISCERTACETRCICLNEETVLPDDCRVWCEEIVGLRDNQASGGVVIMEGVRVQILAFMIVERTGQIIVLNAVT
ncbi:hypothetical protein KC19_10G141500 [Ceratodon purpureus]|uniref:Uncharacterized protein n=1 Tax=Ceratodon purpureus TaxID=3225 RepID=A0A8T0GKB8_CERPU|nr:hypothetical protein KC19_10G141500 [Ceratodon purpureus]